MNQPPQEQPAPQPQATAPCGHCGHPQTWRHCDNPRCTWIKCGDCHRLSDPARPPKAPGSGQ